MKGNIFLDNTIVIYAHTNIDLQKQKIAQKTIVESKTFISAQVLNEVLNVLRRKFKKSLSL
jgi:predicted nucleic acid-binding protein